MEYTISIDARIADAWDEWKAWTLSNAKAMVDAQAKRLADKYKGQLAAVVAQDDTGREVYRKEIR